MEVIDEKKDVEVKSSVVPLLSDLEDFERELMAQGVIATVSKVTKGENTGLQFIHPEEVVQIREEVKTVDEQIPMDQPVVEDPIVLQEEKTPIIVQSEEPATALAEALSQLDEESEVFVFTNVSKEQLSLLNDEMDDIRYPSIAPPRLVTPQISPRISEFSMPVLEDKLDLEEKVKVEEKVQLEEKVQFEHKMEEKIDQNQVEFPSLSMNIEDVNLDVEYPALSIKDVMAGLDMEAYPKVGPVVEDSKIIDFDAERQIYRDLMHDFKNEEKVYAQLGEVKVSNVVKSMMPDFHIQEATQKFASNLLDRIENASLMIDRWFEECIDRLGDCSSHPLHKLLEQYLLFEVEKHNCASSIIQLKNEQVNLVNKAWILVDKEQQERQRCGDGTTIVFKHIYKVASMEEEAVGDIAECAKKIKDLKLKEHVSLNYQSLYWCTKVEIFLFEFLKANGFLLRYLSHL